MEKEFFKINILESYKRLESSIKIYGSKNILKYQTEGVPNTSYIEWVHKPLQEY